MSQELISGLIGFVGLMFSKSERDAPTSLIAKNVVRQVNIVISNAKATIVSMLTCIKGTPNLFVY